MAYYPPEPPIAPIPQPPHTAGQSFQGFRSLIEPSQIPSPIAAANADQAIWDNEFYMTCSSQRSMPLSRSDYVAIDQGTSFLSCFDVKTIAFCVLESREFIPTFPAVDALRGTACLRLGRYVSNTHRGHPSAIRGSEFAGIASTIGRLWRWWPTTMYKV
jgi:hypothetical protein